MYLSGAFHKGNNLTSDHLQKAVQKSNNRRREWEVFGTDIIGHHAHKYSLLCSCVTFLCDKVPTRLFNDVLAAADFFLLRLF